MLPHDLAKFEYSAVQLIIHISRNDLQHTIILFIKNNYLAGITAWYIYFCVVFFRVPFTSFNFDTSAIFYDCLLNICHSVEQHVINASVDQWLKASKRASWWRTF